MLGTYFPNRKLPKVIFPNRAICEAVISQVYPQRSVPQPVQPQCSAITPIQAAGPHDSLRLGLANLTFKKLPLGKLQIYLGHCCFGKTPTTSASSKDSQQKSSNFWIFKYFSKLYSLFTLDSIKVVKIETLDFSYNIPGEKRGGRDNNFTFKNEKTNNIEIIMFNL